MQLQLSKTYPSFLLFCSLKKLVSKVREFLPCWWPLRNLKRRLLIFLKQTNKIGMLGSLVLSMSIDGLAEPFRSHHSLVNHQLVDCFPSYIWDLVGSDCDWQCHLRSMTSQVNSGLLFVFFYHPFTIYSCFMWGNKEFGTLLPHWTKALEESQPFVSKFYLLSQRKTTINMFSTWQNFNSSI